MRAVASPKIFYHFTWSKAAGILGTPITLKNIIGGSLDKGSNRDAKEELSKKPSLVSPLKLHLRYLYRVDGAL